MPRINIRCQIPNFLQFVVNGCINNYNSFAELFTPKTQRNQLNLVLLDMLMAFASTAGVRSQL